MDSSSDELECGPPLFPALPRRRPLAALLALTATTADYRNMFHQPQALRAALLALELDLLVLENMALDVPDGDDRFKYLRLYEETLRHRKKSPGAPDDQGLVFNLTGLSDFERYVKQTELNAAIGARMPQKPANVLTTGPGIPAGFDAHDEALAPPRSKASTVYALDFSDLNFDSYAAPLEGSDDLLVYLQRRLKIRHLQMILFGGTLGVGLFLNSGKAINIAGGFGATLAFAICGIIVLATLVSFCEMVTLVLVVDGVLGLLLRFVDDAFGFAAGWLYFLSFAVGLAGETVACVILLGYYPSLRIPESEGASAGFVTFFLVVTVSCNLMDVRVFGEIEYMLSLLKLLAALALIILMIVVNVGGTGGPYVGFRFWDYSKSDFANNIIYGLFRPAFNLHDTGTLVDGVEGARGRFMLFMVALLVTLFAYLGSEIVCIAACEAQNPRKALPSATKRVFFRIIIFYILAVFVVLLNIYAGDPRLLRYYSGATGVPLSEMLSNVAIQHVGGYHCAGAQLVYAGFGTGSQLPWNIALQSANECTAAGVVNGFLVFFALLCGNAQVYVSSRTAYSLALQGKAPRVFARVNRWGIPYCAVLLLGAFGLLAYICVNEHATVVFQNLTLVISLLGIMVWFSMCLLFIRFYYGLKRRPDIISRDDKEYPYKLPFQPYTAIFGLIGSLTIIVGMGYVVFLGGEWNTWFFFSSYGTIIVFFVLYFGYKIIRRSRIPTLETIDFDTGRTEMDRYLWDKGRLYNRRSVKDVASRFAHWLA